MGPKMFSDMERRTFPMFPIKYHHEPEGLYCDLSFGAVLEAIQYLKLCITAENSTADC